MSRDTNNKEVISVYRPGKSIAGYQPSKNTIDRSNPPGKKKDKDNDDQSNK